MHPPSQSELYAALHDDLGRILFNTCYGCAPEISAVASHGTRQDQDGILKSFKPPFIVRPSHISPCPSCSSAAFCRMNDAHFHSFVSG